MDKLLVLTDLHLRAEGKTIIGLDPVARCRAALEAGLTAHGDARALILMGDLTHGGHVAEYEILRNLLAEVQIPVLPMLGNHDDRAHFDQVFPEATRTDAGHLQQVMDLGAHRLITLDSLDAGAKPAHSGWLCPARLDWLDRALATAEGRMPLVFIQPTSRGAPTCRRLALARALRRNSVSMGILK